MNILFLTLLDFKSFSERNIYCDLIREFIKNGHDIYCVSPVERRFDIPTHLEEKGRLLKLRIGNTQKNNIFEKGISILLMESMIKAGIKKYFSNTKFDYVMYTTPPITLVSIIKQIKNRDNAKTYLMLKDIFPQNAVDLGMLKTSGLRGVIYRYFRMKEKELYAISDRIGCMSQANVDYLIHHNPQVNPAIVDICPNAIDIRDVLLSVEERKAIRQKYEIPQEMKVFVYGGNLGRPQGIPFIIECLKTQKNSDDAFFLIIGNGTEYEKLKNYINSDKPTNVKLMQYLPKDDFDMIVAACDVGMIFLDHRFTIPNFPSRLLSYMQAKIPILACTDSSTDIGKVIVEGEFGWWCESNDTWMFGQMVYAALNSNLLIAGDNAYQYLRKQFTAEHSYKAIMQPLVERRSWGTK